MPSNTYEKIYLLHSHSNNRHFWGVFSEVNKDILFFVVNPVNNKNNQQHKNVNLKQTFTSMLAELEDTVSYVDWDVSNT
jgi:hypothetical protein